jgi:Protein of unknown function (DUF3995)
LVAAAGVHAAWAVGSSWPAQNRVELAELVVGTPTFPSAAATWGVVGLCLTGAALVLAQINDLSSLRRRAPRAVKAAVGVLAAGLLIRGVGGLVVSGGELVDATENFRRWDLILYSPVCIILGLCAAAAFMVRRAPVHAALTAAAPTG